MAEVNDRLGLKVNVNVPRTPLAALSKPVSLRTTRRLATGQVTPVLPDRVDLGAGAAAGLQEGITDLISSFQEARDPTKQLEKEVAQKALQLKSAEIDQALVDLEVGDKVDKAEKEFDLKKLNADTATLNRQIEETENRQGVNAAERQTLLISRLTEAVAKTPDAAGTLSLDFPGDEAVKGFSLTGIDSVERFSALLGEVGKAEPARLDAAARTLGVDVPQSNFEGSTFVTDAEGNLARRDAAALTDTEFENLLRQVGQNVKLINAAKDAGASVTLGADGKIKSVEAIEANTPNDLRRKRQADPDFQRQASLAGVTRNPTFFTNEKEAEIESRKGAQVREDLEAQQAQGLQVIADLDRFIRFNKGVETGGVWNNLKNSVSKFIGDADLIEMQSIVDKITPLMRQGLPGAASERDVRLFASGTVGIAKPIEANRNIVNAKLAMFQLQQDRINYYAQFQRLHNTYTGAKEEWQAYVAANPLYTADSTENNIKEVPDRKTIQQWTAERELPHVRTDEDVANLPAGTIVWNEITQSIAEVE